MPDSNFVKTVKSLPGLRIYSRLNEQGGHTAVDISAQGNHSGVYGAGQDEAPLEPSPVHGAYLLDQPGYPPFIGGDPTSTGVVFVSNCNRSGAEGPYLGPLNEPYAYGAYVTLPEEGPLEPSKRALWAATSQMAIGFFVELNRELNITADLLSSVGENASGYGWTFQVNSEEHAFGINGKPPGIGSLPRQLIMYILWHVGGTAVTTEGQPLLTNVSLSKYAWENLIVGTILKGVYLPNGEFSNIKNGENGDAQVITVKKVETTPGVSKDGELVLNLNAAVSGENTITAMNYSVVFSKQQLLIGRRYLVVCCYNGELPGPERVKYYLNGLQMESVVQPTQENNVAYGGVPAPKSLQYPSTDVGYPPRLACLNAGGRLAAYSDSLPARHGEWWMATITPPLATIDELWKQANEGVPVMPKPANQFTEKGKTIEFALPQGENIYSYEAIGLPTGLTCSSSTGIITGTITASSNSYPVTVKGKNSLGATVETSFTWIVEPINQVLMGSRTANTKERNTAAGKIRTCSYIPPKNGTVKFVEVHGHRAEGAGGEIVVGIWADAAGKPGALIAETAAFLVPPQPEGAVNSWYPLSLLKELVVIAGTQYWIGILALVHEFVPTYNETTTGYQSETPANIKKVSEVTKWKLVTGKAGGVFDFAACGPFVVPTATTEAASGLQEASTTLHGTINPDGSEVESYYFEYGRTNAYGTRTASSTIASGSAGVPVSAIIAGLTSGTYHCRLVAIGVGGQTFGADETFSVATSTIGGITMVGNTTIPSNMEVIQ